MYSQSYNPTLGGYMDINEDAIGYVEQAIGTPEVKSAKFATIVNARAAQEESPRTKAFIRRTQHVAKNHVSGIMRGDRKIQNIELFDVQALGGQKQARFFKEDKNKTIGLTNVSGGKVRTNFLLVGIRLLICVDATGAGTAGIYGEVAGVEKNGNFTLRVGNVTIMEDQPIEVFNTDNRTDIEVGYYEIGTPRMLTAETGLDFRVEFPVALPANTYIKAILVGAADLEATI